MAPDVRLGGDRVKTEQLRLWISVCLALGAFGCVSDALVATSDQASNDLHSHPEPTAPASQPYAATPPPTAAGDAQPSAAAPAPSPKTPTTISTKPNERIGYANGVIGDIDGDGFEDFVLSTEPPL